MQKAVPRFLAVFLPIALLGLTAIGVVLFANFERVKGQILGNEDRIVTLAARATRNALDGPPDDLLYLGQKRQLLDILLGDASARPLIESDFRSFLGRKRTYDRIRLLDARGREIVRVDYRDGDPQIAPAANLQSSADRYDLAEAANLPAGEMYLSRIDLGAERGGVEVPYKPTIRLILPLRDGSSLEGFVVLNYLAGAWLREVRLLGEQSNGRFALLNSAGFALVSSDKGSEWAFMFPERAGQSLGRSRPELWQALQRHGADRIDFPRSWVTTRQMCGKSRGCTGQSAEVGTLSRLSIDAADLPWFFVTEVPHSAMFAGGLVSGHWTAAYAVIATVLVLLAAAGRIAWRLASAVERISAKEQELRRSTSLIEAFVDRNPVAMYVRDAVGRYLYANRASQEILGANVGALLADSPASAVPRQMLMRAADDDARIIAAGTPLQFRMAFSRDGADRHLNVVKFPLRDSAGGVYAVGGIATDITTLVETEAARHESEALFGEILQATPNALLMVDDGGRIVLANATAETMFGYAKDELIGQPIEVLVPERFRSNHPALRRAFFDAPVKRTLGLGRDLYGVRKDGTEFAVEIGLSPTTTSRGPMVIGAVVDVTQRKQLELQLRQSQKMEAIGQLTGGVAHDFNNLLGVIVGNLDLMEPLLSGNEEVERRLETAQRAAMRGADLTGRLLAFSRRQPLHPVPASINALVSNVVEMSRRTIGSDVKITMDLDSRSPCAVIDESGLENALLNLMLNSRDAMPAGGSVMVATKVVDLDANFTAVQLGELLAGAHVCIAVSDSGKGMTREELRRAFEPFFTTKARDKGTGLGLATVYGFVKQSRGHVNLYSEIDVGTTVRIYLPLHAGSAQVVSMSQQPASLITFHGAVLVVDDEPDMLEVASSHLKGMGLRAIAATDGPSAIECFRATPDIGLLLTDVIMSGGMNGPELARELRAVKPDLVVLYSSGFPSDALSQRRGYALDAPVLAKPYSKSEFTIAVTRAIAQAGVAQ